MPRTAFPRVLSQPALILAVRSEKTVQDGMDSQIPVITREAIYHSKPYRLCRLGRFKRQCLKIHLIPYVAK